jgi:Transposase DDE domain
MAWSNRPLCFDPRNCHAVQGQRRVPPSHSKQKRKVTNCAAYDASLRRRASLTIWFSDEAIGGWRAAPRTTRGAEPWYSPLAILTALKLRSVFRRSAAVGRVNRLNCRTLRPRSGGSRPFDVEPAGKDAGGAETAVGKRCR